MISLYLKFTLSILIYTFHSISNIIHIFFILAKLYFRDDLHILLGTHIKKKNTCMRIKCKIENKIYRDILGD